jgi:DNA polymerase-3 subunit delta'
MIIGHQRILEFLKKSIENKRLAHAYLFTGSAHLGKKTVALEFIRMLTGQEIDQAVHPDILIVEPEIVEKDGIKKELEIGIDQARKIQHQMNLFPYRADYKIALIDQADKMTSEASNCLLKTLEEPSGKAILILVTANPQRLLSTIISRCQLINFLPVAKKEIEKGLAVILRAKSEESRANTTGSGVYSGQNEGPAQDDKLKRIIRLANGRPGLAIEYLENPELLEEQNKIIRQLEKLLRADLNERYRYVEEIAKNVPVARQILNYWLFWFRDLLLLTVGCSDLVLCPEISQYQGAYSLPKLKSVIQTIKKTDWLLANPSINARLALEVLMLEL